MPKLKTLTLAEQVAMHLRQEIREGRWNDQMAGRDVLARELGVSARSVRGALDILEKEGLIIPQGPGQRSKIAPSSAPQNPKMKISILLYEEADRYCHYLVDLRHRLLEMGHAVEFTSKSLLSLKLDLKRVKSLVQRTPSDAWVIVAGSYDVLQWFSELSLPAFALFGRHHSLSIAASSLDKPSAMEELVHQLIGLGHRRIVMLANEERRKPAPGATERCFLNVLKRHGLGTGNYNLPDWAPTPDGINSILDSLFSHTPPTALILNEPTLFLAVQDNLSRRGICAPAQVSLICLDYCSEFTLHSPAISHLSWDTDSPVRHVMQWAKSISSKKDDQRQRTTKVEFMEGGTIGPPPGL